MYYLISPTKEIIYTTNNLHEYSEIINKKTAGENKMKDFLKCN